MLPHRMHVRLRSGLDALAKEQRLRGRRTVTSLSSTECLVDGRRCVHFASNDYLGLAHHPEVTRVFAEVANSQVGARASALIAGRSIWHEQLERDLAEFESAQGAVLFPSGYAANLGTLTSLIRPGDAVYCDRDNHASLIDGCRSSAGQMLIFRHEMPDRLRKSLKKRRALFDQVFLVCDSVFSMDGTLAPLVELADIAQEHDAVLIVDEAHGTGVFGTGGRGVCEFLGVEHRVPVRIGTLSKAVGALGGFVTADQDVCDWLWQSARSQFFSTALPPAVCAAASAALGIIAQDENRRTRLHTLCQLARQQLQDAGLTGIADSQGPIIPVLLNDDRLAVRVSEQLLQAGFFIPAIRPPTVSAGTARLRMSLCSEHTPEQIATAVRHMVDLVARLRT